MKKIFKAASWDGSNFSASNVTDRSHWFIKLLDAALNALDIGSYSFSFVSNYEVTVATARYGNFSVYHPQSNNIADTPYIAYVDSENKELCMCASNNTVAAPDHLLTGNERIGNFARGGMYSQTSSGTSALPWIIYSVGGLLLVKFAGTGVKVFSSGDGYQGACSYYSQYSNMPGITISRIGCPLPDRWECLAAPIDAVEIKYAHKPIVYGLSGVINYASVSSSAGQVRYSNYVQFDNEYFVSIYDIDKYYLGAMKSSDNKKFIYNGLLFDVDDATDITVV